VRRIRGGKKAPFSFAGFDCGRGGGERGKRGERSYLSLAVILEVKEGGGGEGRGRE